ncbi:branched-chain amino acid ABC transporter permease [Pararhodobacter sp.]|uniref:branched-chain amino acid ABC transporter permease n=1 Tax=Pararhodobacter sp. TaxID=2127056 RepID=UPI002AFE5961|nr:branched-chain amino acid ABC transporter permease [Pararhodobacter sp.]
MSTHQLHKVRFLSAVATPILLIGLLLLGALLISIFGDRSLQRTAAEGLIYVTLVVGFWIFVGNSGVISFAHAAFALIGAYVSGWLTIRPAMKGTLMEGLPQFLLDAEWHVFPAAIAGGIAAMLLALISGAAILRLSGIAASIATFAFLAMINTIWSNWSSVTGGVSTVAGLPRYVDIWVALVWASVAIIAASVYALSASGLALPASREDEVAAQASAVDQYRHRLLSYTISAFFCGVGGALFAHTLGILNVDSFYLSMTFLLLAMLVVGGIGSLSGAVLGVIAISICVELLKNMEHGVTLYGYEIALPAGSKEVLIGIIMILVLIFRPLGLMAGKDLTLPRKWLARFTK